MHYLRTFLVHLPEHLRFTENDHEDTKEEARGYAKEATLQFLREYGDKYGLFDYYSTSPLAGRWAHDIDDVILGCDSNFTDILRQIYYMFVYDVQFCYCRAKTYLEKEKLDIRDLEEDDIKTLIEKGIGSSTFVFNIKCIADKLSGTINYDSTFIDIQDHVAYFSKGQLQEIIEKRHEYALVNVDCHI